LVKAKVKIALIHPIKDAPLILLDARPLGALLKGMLIA
jgi:hypothetical protein